jgi:hypothetical protein
MHELLISGRKETTQPTGDVLFLFDPGTGKDEVTNQTCIALSGVAVDMSVLIDEKPTLKFAAVNNQGLITFPTPIAFDALEGWTVEWSSRPTSFATAYANELFLDITTTLGYPIGCRWGDAGYNNRLQFNISNWANANIGQPPVNKTAVVNKVNRWAMVFRNNRLQIFKDGVLQMLAFGTSTTYAQDYMAKNGALPTVTKLYLGYFNSINQAWLGNFGRIRISNFARYLGNYTPTPF